ncbi:hypothetical protein BMA721280_I0054 [Burkholderia mallei 2002721280]|uniref:Uncharacterized protein n=3 Tax=pseudomallei group TaxID=111527 RepID=A0A0E1VPV7_BURPE|nr:MULTISPECIES: hypothetical protein [pseudomallei group]ABN93523.1 hypothetical protein BURPS1106A_A0045 [Burkholderia pseudomallei 1106a]ABO01561.1 hypothetical protein BMA10247_A0047 [Burkholderia mallei NCTC 10247]AFR17985.1 hypothetical protein BPC006_II0045 [Burkholderia pseudomallei BPC006]EBA44747.1 hypothetical protein BURPS305_0603 [Burkholderia pseudomallei 305]EDK86695.1 hypothetical protein BMA721280_I0054 [Burkholderia mallei 2002721280]EEC33751.1 conserved hypothetical protein
MRRAHRAHRREVDATPSLRAVREIGTGPNVDIVTRSRRQAAALIARARGATAATLERRSRDMHRHRPAADMSRRHTAQHARRRARLTE